MAGSRGSERVRTLLLLFSQLSLTLLTFFLKIDFFHVPKWPLAASILIVLIAWYARGTHLFSFQYPFIMERSS